MAEVEERVCHSIVIPLYNELDNIIPLYKQVRETMEMMDDSLELVFVDDGSTDGSSNLLRDIALQDGRVTVVKLSRKFGKLAALTAGFDVALGDYVITMEGDLQHSSSDIPKFIEKLREGYDVVCGRRFEHSDVSWVQRVFNRVANWTAAKLCGVNISDFANGFRAYKRELVTRLPVYGESQHLIPILALRPGSRICEVPIAILPRGQGSSKYGLRQKIPFLFDLITVRFLSAYLSRPMRFFGTGGILAILLGSLIVFWLLARNWIYHMNVLQGHSALMISAAVLVILGMQLFALGLLAEMQLRLYHDRLREQGFYSVSAGRRLSHRNDETIRP